MGCLESGCMCDEWVTVCDEWVTVLLTFSSWGVLSLVQYCSRSLAFHVLVYVLAYFIDAYILWSLVFHGLLRVSVCVRARACVRVC